jgi:hypothetical protein
MTPSILVGCLSFIPYVLGKALIRNIANLQTFKFNSLKISTLFDRHYKEAQLVKLELS